MNGKEFIHTIILGIQGAVIAIGIAYAAVHFISAHQDAHRQEVENTFRDAQ